MPVSQVTLQIVAICATICFCAADAAAQNQSRNGATGRIEQVFAFPNQMPTGVTVSQSGRIFVNYPRWEDPVAFTVAELKDGREIPFPDTGIQPA